MAYVGKHIRYVEPSKGRIALGWVITIVSALVLSIILRTFVISAYYVPTGSMETTIMTDDRIFAQKITYKFKTPESGDVVIFLDPEDDSRFLVKRCIATQGQTVDLENGEVFVDGVALTEDYTTGSSYPLNSEINYPYTVSEDCIWVMGDNRENSNDSRKFGEIDTHNVVAKGVCVLWPISHISLL